MKNFVCFLIVIVGPLVFAQIVGIGCGAKSSTPSAPSTTSISAKDTGSGNPCLNADGSEVVIVNAEGVTCRCNGDPVLPDGSPNPTVAIPFQTCSAPTNTPIATQTPLQSSPTFTSTPVPPTATFTITYTPSPTYTPTANPTICQDCVDEFNDGMAQLKIVEAQQNADTILQCGENCVSFGPEDYIPCVIQCIITSSLNPLETWQDDLDEEIIQSAENICFAQNFCNQQQ